MPSFDIVSEVDLHEVSNAVDQTNREVGTRFDFKGSDAGAGLKNDMLTLHAENEFQVRQVLDILHKKMAKRGIDIAALKQAPVQTSGNKASMEITVRQGIDKDTARQLVKKIKETGIRVQASIQGDQVRVSGKKRDDLQSIISKLRESDCDLPLQFVNFRD
ncbi:MAG TPA: YajQ family cyclic di-GMP-binding protein [Gammaproteobacteria bacterium]|nr:YajQ family cyclic di-GMP-binding protein [Gammaproteobacteria bacterium]